MLDRSYNVDMNKLTTEKRRQVVAIHYMHYNFCRVHETLRVTPAMEVGITDHVWSIEEMIALLGANHLARSSEAA